MKKFEIGKSYSMRSACDHECVWTYVVTARTASTVTLQDGPRSLTCRINRQLSEYRGAESVRPLGSYSLAPILSA